MSILRRLIKKIGAAYPKLKITIRSNSGFSCAPFYELVDEYNLLFASGIASNNMLKQKTIRSEKAVRKLYVEQEEKQQHFIEYTYQAKSWHKSQKCYAKVESTGMGLNIRYFVSTIEKQEEPEIN